LRVDAATGDGTIECDECKSDSTADSSLAADAEAEAEAEPPPAAAEAVGGRGMSSAVCTGGMCAGLSRPVLSSSKRVWMRAVIRGRGLRSNTPVTLAPALSPPAPALPPPDRSMPDKL
jgi:hypothetical protein